MDETALLTSVALFTLLAGVCAIVFNKAKLPPLIGYLTAGIVVTNVFVIDETGMNAVELLSDFGLVLLMFCIGLEINLTKIKKQGKFAVLVAVVQLPILVVGGIAAGSIMGFNGVQAIALGAIISGSSTAAVMAVLKSQNRLNKDNIETLVLVLIMEDIGQVVILSMLTPAFAGSSMNTSDLVVLITMIAIFMVASLVIGLKYEVAPKLMNWITDHVPWETAIVISVGLAFGMALLATKAGLSMAIGSFMMGLLLSSARKGKEINEAIEPMKSLFMAMFFISVGMEVHIDTLVQNLWTIFGLYGLFAILMTVAVFLGYWVAGESGRIGFLSAISLTAMGEFAFIIAKEALGYGVVDDGFYTSIIGAALVSMVMLPILSRSSDRLWNLLSRPAFLNKWTESANRARDDLYQNIYDTNKKTRRLLRRGMAYAYVDVLIILLIEVVFFVSEPALSPLLDNMYGGGVHTWDFALVILNFIVLIPPIAYLVENLKRLDELIVNNSRRMAVRSGKGTNVYAEFLEFNSYVAVTILDLALILIIPNPLTLAEHLIVAAVAVLIVALIIMRRRKRRSKAQMSADIFKEERNRYKPASNHPPKAGVAQPGGASDS